MASKPLPFASTEDMLRYEADLVLSLCVAPSVAHSLASRILSYLDDREPSDDRIHHDDPPDGWSEIPF